jgi:hypothetical protein
MLLALFAAAAGVLASALFAAAGVLASALFAAAGVLAAVFAAAGVLASAVFAAAGLGEFTSLTEYTGLSVPLPFLTTLIGDSDAGVPISAGLFVPIVIGDVPTSAALFGPIVLGDFLPLIFHLKCTENSNIRFLLVQQMDHEEDANTVNVATTPSVPVERRTTTTKNRVQCKQDLVITWLQEFYTHPGHLEELLPILKGESPMSLRLIDYFVTNYSKKHNTFYFLSGRQFIVYFQYKRELNAYSKRLFDPFCRRERIMFEARGHEPFVTTVGQLNFFRWAIEKNILKHIAENRDDIERDMNATLREHYSRSTTRTQPTITSGISASTSAASAMSDTLTADESQTIASSGSGGSRKKRSELTQSAMKKVNIHVCDVVVSFN